jgi:hypothetical protein
MVGCRARRRNAELGGSERDDVARVWTLFGPSLPLFSPPAQPPSSVPLLTHPPSLIHRCLLSCLSAACSLDSVDRSIRAHTYTPLDQLAKDLAKSTSLFNFQVDFQVGSKPQKSYGCCHIGKIGKKKNHHHHSGLYDIIHEFDANLFCEVRDLKSLCPQ